MRKAVTPAATRGTASGAGSGGSSTSSGPADADPAASAELRIAAARPNQDPPLQSTLP